jgi:hypothetical protein
MNLRQAATILPTFRANDQALVIFAYLLVRTGMLMQEIEMITGLSTDTATKAVKSLIGKGLLVKQTGRHGKAVYLPIADSFFGLLNNGQIFLPEQNPQIADSVSTTTTTIGREIIDNEEVVVAVRQTPQIADSRNKNDPYELKKAREIHRGELDRERRTVLEEYGIPVNANLKACQLFGIGEPAASELSELKHVTPQLIEAHVRSLVQGETKGLAIVRIRCDEMPRTWTDEISQNGTPSLLTWSEEKAARKQGMTLNDWHSEYEEPDEE